jgi:hypothetical protein
VSWQDGNLSADNGKPRKEDDMRVRYQMAGQEMQAVCDMTEKKAREMFDKLKNYGSSSKGFCEWAELVGEDDDNYMDILDSFDHIKQAQMLFKITR